MATIKLTDDLGLDADITMAPFSSLLKYFKQLPALRLSNGDFSKAAGMTLDQPALTMLNSGLSFTDSVAIGPGANALSISAGLHGLLALIPRTPSAVKLPDVSAGEIQIAEGTCYLELGVQASVGVSVGPDSGQLQFGVGPGETIDIRNYQSFPLKHEITLLDAVEQTVGNFIIPASADDLSSLPEGCVATVTGTGSLKLSATANLLAVTNPLASAALPAPLPALSVTAGSAAQVGAGLTLKCTFQVCSQKLASGHVQLGWYRQTSSEFDVTASVSEGLSAGFGSTDLFSTIIGAISASASADRNELQKAGLPPDQISAIQSAVKAAVNRKLQLALSTEISATESGDAIFLYDIDIAALTPDSRQALDQALCGDLTGLHSGPVPGVTVVKSIWERARKYGVQLDVNLLGILNVGSVSTLTCTGSVLFEPATGALVITDKSAAQRIRSTTVNFGADTQKLRHVMAESFLLTAAYQGSQQQVGAPALRCSHDFFDLENDASRDQMVRDLRVGAALGLLSGEDATPPAGIDDFGRTVIHARTDYDNGSASALFLDADGAAFPQLFYENIGRATIQLLVSTDDEDAVRLQPATDDNLWKSMKGQGQPGFAALFPDVSAPLLGDITTDYTVIIWWADAMAGASQILAAIRKWFSQHPTAAVNDPQFQRLRQDLAAHMKKVAGATKEEFGKPWGLIAMDRASGRRAGASILIAGPKFASTKQRALTATPSS
jgi:hypothetical protein